MKPQVETERAAILKELDEMMTKYSLGRRDAAGAPAPADQTHRCALKMHGRSRERPGATARRWLRF